MKTSLYPSSLLLVVCLALGLCGCSPKEEDSSSLNSASQNTEAVSIELDAAKPASPDQINAATPPPNSIPAMDFAQVQRPINAQGDTMTDLEFLNHLVEQINEARSTDVEIKQKAFKTEAEQMAYEESQQKSKEPVRDLNELVAAGVIKTLPSAPNGQRYAIDTTTGKVVLQETNKTKP
jgi:hypothetical protein